MSCSSAICTVNSSTTALEANSQIPFGTTVRRFGKAINQDAGSILLTQRGYYDVAISLDVSPEAAGDITAQLFVNGQALEGASATQTVAEADNTANLYINYLVRLCACDTTDILSVKLQDAGTVSRMSTVVTKV